MAVRTESMSGRRPWLSVGLVVACAVLMAMGVAATIGIPGRLSADRWDLLIFVFPVAAFSAVGGLISLRRPENPIGWLLAAIGLLFAVVVSCTGVSAWALETEALPKAVAEWISVGSSAWVPALSLIGTQLPLRLPDGALPSMRWRWYSRVSIALIAVSTLGMAAQPGRVEDIPGTESPVHLQWAEPLATVFLLVVVCFVGGFAALIVRYRRADSHDRLQLRWIAFGGVVFLAVYLVTLPLESILADSGGGSAITYVALLAFGALPISIGYAVLRHRLYDIDLVVNRTLVYGLLTATLAGAYLGTVLLLQLALGPVTSGSSLAVAVSTLAVAALFRPARQRIQELVDRRFYRRKYDAAQTLETFGARLRDEVDLDALGVELREVVTKTMQPAHVSLWLR
jgi:hypothetical protein